MRSTVGRDYLGAPIYFGDYICSMKDRTKVLLVNKEVVEWIAGRDLEDYEKLTHRQCESWHRQLKDRGVIEKKD